MIECFKHLRLGHSIKILNLKLKISEYGFKNQRKNKNNKRSEHP